MAYEMKPGTFNLFTNQRKVKDNQPDWRGTICTPAGKKLEIVGWFKTGPGGKYISGKIGEFQAKETSARPEARTRPDSASRQSP